MGTLGAGGRFDTTGISEHGGSKKPQNDRSPFMRKQLLISVSTLALIASAGIGAAQDRIGPGGASGQAPAAQQAPSGAERGDRAQPSQSQQPRQEDSRDNRAQGTSPRENQAQDDQKAPRQNQAQDRDQKQQPKQNQAHGGDQAKPDRQVQDRDRRDGDRKSTTGQGAAGSSGASLTTEQRTKITTNIRQSNVRPLTNVNFNVSVGTVVPRSVTLHPLPAAVIEVYPDWRPYRFVLVGDDILVIDPATHRIVAVLDA